VAAAKVLYGVSPHFPSGSNSSSFDTVATSPTAAAGVTTSSSGMVSRPPPHGHKYLYWNPDEVYGKGSGVYTRGPIKEGEIVMQIVGPAITWKQLVAIEDEELRERYLQVGPDVFYGPAGDYSDKTNHSCDPNCIVKIYEEQNKENIVNDMQGKQQQGALPRIFLVARCDIETGAEITYDYCTVQCNQTWEMPCLCGSPICRKVVLNITDLTPATMAQYRASNAVPEYAWKYWLKNQKTSTTKDYG